MESENEATRWPVDYESLKKGDSIPAERLEKIIGLNRDNPKYLQSLAFTIKTVASQTPNGLLVFFPSYVLMELFRRVFLWWL